MKLHLGVVRCHVSGKNSLVFAEDFDTELTAANEKEVIELKKKAAEEGNEIRFFYIDIPDYKLNDLFKDDLGRVK